MSLSVILDNLLNPPILFFFLGALATLVRSDLEVPQPIARFLALYLLMAIGIKGGVELRAGDASIWSTLAAAMIMASLVPLYSFFILRRRVDVANAAAICATYGSISAVTFITAVDFLRREGIESSGAMVAAMALMESPAIIIGVLFYRLYDRQAATAGDAGATGTATRSLGIHWGELLRDAVLNASIFLLVGSLIIG
ncbi:MAG: sodium-dependent bicarbonate transport family permease, partial [Caldilineaceae bacterium]